MISFLYLLKLSKACSKTETKSIKVFCFSCSINERMEDSLKEMPPGMDVIKPDVEMKVPFPAQIVSQNNEDSESSDSVIEEANIKLSELVSIAMEESISRAVTMALKSGNAFLIDKLRDSLADKYYQELKNKRLI